jgi:hypothetical protein
MNAASTKRNDVVLGGGKVATWLSRCRRAERMQVNLRTKGPPLDAMVELWSGPDRAPNKMRVHTEDGKRMPFRAFVETPSAYDTLAVRNTGRAGSSITSTVCISNCTVPMAGSSANAGGIIQDPLNARIEVLRGLHNVKQIIELYADDGKLRPFFCTITVAEAGHTLRVINTGPIECPMLVAMGGSPKA